MSQMGLNFSYLQPDNENHDPVCICNQNNLQRGKTLKKCKCTSCYRKYQNRSTDIPPPYCCIDSIANEKQTTSTYETKYQPKKLYPKSYYYQASNEYQLLPENVQYPYQNNPAYQGQLVNAYQSNKQYQNERQYEHSSRNDSQYQETPPYKSYRYKHSPNNSHQHETSYQSPQPYQNNRQYRDVHTAYQPVQPYQPVQMYHPYPYVNYYTHPLTKCPHCMQHQNSSIESNIDDKEGKTYDPADDFKSDDVDYLWKMAEKRRDQCLALGGFEFNDYAVTTKKEKRKKKVAKKDYDDICYECACRELRRISHEENEEPADTDSSCSGSHSRASQQ